MVRDNRDGGANFEPGRRWLLSTIFVALAATSAQAQFGRPKPPEETRIEKREAGKAFPFGATWVLQTINGTAAPGEAPSFTLDERLRATGFAGCNSFSMALYPIKGQKLAAGAIAVTKRTCDKAVMLSERNFLVGLHSLPAWDLSASGELSLKGATGLMVFRRGI